ncbi:hypothetical protein [Alloactinosynnema sp. L-07]|nr:hypothetical protein [Alloactinosynnema sp. L-07]
MRYMLEWEGAVSPFHHLSGDPARRRRLCAGEVLRLTF